MAFTPTHMCAYIHMHTYKCLHTHTYICVYLCKCFPNILGKNFLLISTLAALLDFLFYF